MIFEMEFTPHLKQLAVMESLADWLVVYSGRRAGKTHLMAMMAADEVAAGGRVLYLAPTHKQAGIFWREFKPYMPRLKGMVNRNTAPRELGYPGYSLGEIEATTADDPDRLRGDAYNLCLIDEFQDQSPRLWHEVIMPMTSSHANFMEGQRTKVVFALTPPSAMRPGNNYAQTVEILEEFESSPFYEIHRFSKWDNPNEDFVSIMREREEMSDVLYRQEIMGELVREIPTALWKREWINRVSEPDISSLDQVIVAVDPSRTTGGDETGIIVLGQKADEIYVLADHSVSGSPDAWAAQIILACERFQTRQVVAESNGADELIERNIKAHKQDHGLSVRRVPAKVSKAQRAQPVATRYASGLVHHTDSFVQLEDQLCLWSPGDRQSPDRLDALVHGVTFLTSRATPFFA